MNIEQKYCEKVSLEHRKKYAQFFTPMPIAQLMAQWILGNKSVKSVLEPAFGLGIFSRVLLKKNPNLEIKGYEIDPIILSEAAKLFAKNPKVSLRDQDYMFSNWHTKYDGVICNPPYFKFHDFDNKQVLEEVNKHLSFNFNGFTNLYALFMLKSISQLKANGRAAYIIPSEFLNSDYGVMIKEYLLKTETLKHIFVFNFKENVFDDALTTASILLFANDGIESKIHFSTINSVTDLASVGDFIESYPQGAGDNSYYSKELDPSVKWRRYYQAQNSDKYQDLVPFANYAKVMRGIATGANDYFTFNKTKANNYGIEMDALMPCICRSKDIKKSYFTSDDFEQLADSDATVFLFNGTTANSGEALDYILKGEREQINEKYLTKNRKPWYAIENRPPSPIWVSVFNRDGLKFVRNKANISNLTTFHCVYPNKSSLYHSIDIDLLFAYLLTPTAKEIFNDNRREYGNGLKKFEPNDLNKAYMVNLALLSDDEQHHIKSLIELYKTEEDERFLLEIDGIIKERFLK